jgi:hypothetical protein
MSSIRRIDKDPLKKQAYTEWIQALQNAKECVELTATDDFRDDPNLIQIKRLCAKDLLLLCEEEEETEGQARSQFAEAEANESFENAEECVVTSEANDADVDDCRLLQIEQFQIPKVHCFNFCLFDLMISPFSSS